MSDYWWRNYSQHPGYVQQQMLDEFRRGLDEKNPNDYVNAFFGAPVNVVVGFQPEMDWDIQVAIYKKVCLSLWNLAFPPNNGVVRILAQGMEVGDAYSQAIEGVLQHPELKDWEYVLTVEHHNCPPADGLIRLVDQMEQHPEFHAIGGLYFTKGEGGCAQIWGDARDLILNFRPQPPDPSGGLVKCYGTGMGFTLYRLSMFREWKGPKPFFRTKRGLNGEGIGTQDLSFASEAFKLGYKFAVEACSVRVGHYDLQGTYGPADTLW